MEEILRGHRRKKEGPEEAVMAPAPLPSFSTVARISHPGYFVF